ncbi:MAG: aminoacyl-histidine dipeptidase, partial [Clostridium sp.]
EFNDEINTMVVHCGLECGCLFPKMPGLDAISIGPDAWGLHSPQERLSISSTERIFHLLKAVLADIH